MGFNQNERSFNYLYILFFVVLFLIVYFSCPSSSHELQPIISSSNTPKSRYQVLYVKKTRPFFLNEQELNNNNVKNKRKMMMMMKKYYSKNTMKNKYYFKTRPFSVMLPKGFVPPSGSSPCHNTNPDSVAFYCDLSTPKP
ncbi:hypothetical protein ACOSP7_011581 [Xanthoceras sorbifolium]